MTREQSLKVIIFFIKSVFTKMFGHQTWLQIILFADILNTEIFPFLDSCVEIRAIISNYWFQVSTCSLIQELNQSVNWPLSTICLGICHSYNNIVQ